MGGRESEIEEVFRRILSTAVTLDRVEIACASDAHLALVWEKALRHTWPVTLFPGSPRSSGGGTKSLPPSCRLIFPGTLSGARR